MNEEGTERGRKIRVGIFVLVGMAAFLGMVYALGARARLFEPRFTITPVPGPRAWVLLMAGLAAAAWVAHRRLTYAY